MTNSFPRGEDKSYMVENIQILRCINIFLNVTRAGEYFWHVRLS